MTAIETDKILLIHPNPDELTFALQHLGFQVVTAVDDHQALAEIRRKEPVVIVMAEALAKSNSDEPFMRIRQRSKAPIIILGQHRKERAGIHFLEAGADAYVPSPLNVRLLLARVHSLLRRSKVRRIG
ncbi:Transcriptional regulatory protein WalR [subsurface metagenome]